MGRISRPRNTNIGTEAASRIAHAGGAIVVADNTFAAPCLTRPLALGIDIVVHSATKFISGMAMRPGAYSRGDAEGEAVGYAAAGKLPQPSRCCLLTRGLKTMPLRVEAASLSEGTELHYAVPSYVRPPLNCSAIHRWDGARSSRCDPTLYQFLSRYSAATGRDNPACGRHASATSPA